MLRRRYLQAAGSIATLTTVGAGTAVAGAERTRSFDLHLQGSGTDNAGNDVDLDVTASGTGTFETDDGAFDEFQATQGTVDVVVTDGSTVRFDQSLDLEEFELERCETDPCEWEVSGLDADNEFEVEGEEPETGSVTRTGPDSFEVTGQGKLEEAQPEAFEASFPSVSGTVTLSG